MKSLESPSKRRKLNFELLEQRQLLTMLAAVPDTTNFPNSAAVQIVAVWDNNGDRLMDSKDYQSICSGAMISSFQVLTAAHCLYDNEQGGDAKWVFAHPGRNDEFNRPFGEVEAFEWYIHPEYEARSSINFDVAVVSLKSRIGNITGWFGLSAIQEPKSPHPAFNLPPELPQTYHLNTLHYPGEENFGYDGYVQYRGDSNYVLFPETWVSSTGPVGHYRVNQKTMWLTGGSSGGPLFLDDHRIVGVVRGGDRVHPGQSGRTDYVKFNLTSPFYLSWITNVMSLTAAPADRPMLVNRDDWFRKDKQATVSSSDVNTGQTLRITAPVFNADTATASNVKVEFRLSADDVFDRSDRLLGTAQISSIAPLTTAQAVLDVSLPRKSTGSYHVVWRIDPADEIPQREPSLHNLVNSEGNFLTSSSGPSWHQQGTSGSVRFIEDQYETNNSRSAATLLPSATWLKNLSGRGVQYDNDYYKIEVPSGRTLVRADLRFSHSHGDIDLQLQDSQGAIIAASRSASDDEFIEALVPTSGTYFLRVFNGNKGNTYDLRWESQVPPDIRPLEISVSGGVREAGQQASIRFKVQNTGGAAEEFRVKVYLSRDNVIDPNKDLEFGRLTISGVAANSTSDQQTINARLPAAGSSFWNVDGEYFVGIVLDADQSIVESDEFNNFGNGIGIDTAAIQVVVHPYGTFTTTTFHTNEIKIPQFDAARGTLQRVEVALVLTQGVTKPALMPGSSGPIPRVDIHAVSLNIGPFQVNTSTLPIPLVGGQSHSEILQPTSVAKTFTGSQLTAFLSGEQRWQLPANSKTAAGFGGHTHEIDTVIMGVTTKFIFDPPDSDLVSTVFSLVDQSVPLSAKDRSRFEVEYTIVNQGPGPSPRFRVGFFMSPDATITTDDVRLATETFAQGISVGGSENRRQSLVLPHATSSLWDGDGLYYVGMILDVDNEVDETSKSNNSNLGLAIDLAQLDVVVKPPGTHVEVRVDANGITFPAFDTSLGKLNRVEVHSILIQGVTDSGGQFFDIPSVHHHTFDFNLGPMQIVALATPQLSGFPHYVSPLQPDRVEFTAGQLNAFSSDQSWSMSPLPFSTSVWGHSHQLLQAVIHTELWYYFDVLPNLRAASLSIQEPLLPGNTSTIKFQIDNAGKADSQAFAVEFFLRGEGYDETEWILGRTMVEGISAESSSQMLDFEIQLPYLDDPFWATTGTYQVGMRIDPEQMIDEIDSGDNENQGESIDSQSFSVSLIEDVSPIDLGSVTFGQHVLDDGESWFRISTIRSGPLTLIANSDTSNEPLRLTVYRGFASDDSDSGISEAAIKPNEIGRTLGHQGTARLDIIAESDDLYYVRVAGGHGGGKLIIANVFDAEEGSIRITGTSGNDVLRVFNGPNPTIAINEVLYSIAALDASVIYLDGAGGSNQFYVEALADFTIEIVSNGTHLEVDASHSKAVFSTLSVDVEGRQSIRFTENLPLRIVNDLSWRNVTNPFDVNNDGRVSPIDALLVINTLNSVGASSLPDLDEIRIAPNRYLDTNGDERVSASDALLVINYLNSRSGSTGGEGELDDPAIHAVMTMTTHRVPYDPDAISPADELDFPLRMDTSSQIFPPVPSANQRHRFDSVIDQWVIEPNDNEELLEELLNLLAISGIQLGWNTRFRL